MAAASFEPSLSFVWQKGFDDPDDGYHVTPGDAGGGTVGGVIEASWQTAVRKGLVAGALRDAARAQLAVVLRDDFWGAACDALPPGLDLALFNGRMMSGGYPGLFQQCLGCVGDDVDGDIGPETLAAAAQRDVPTLIHALAGAHFAYLKRLPAWPEFEGGWSKRIAAARLAALALAKPAA